MLNANATNVGQLCVLNHILSKGVTAERKE